MLDPVREHSATDYVKHGVGMMLRQFWQGVVEDWQWAYLVTKGGCEHPEGCWNHNFSHFWTIECRKCGMITSAYRAGHYRKTGHLHWLQWWSKEDYFKPRWTISVSVDDPMYTNRHIDFLTAEEADEYLRRHGLPTSPK